MLHYPYFSPLNYDYRYKMEYKTLSSLVKNGGCNYMVSGIVQEAKDLDDFIFYSLEVKVDKNNNFSL